MTEDVNAFLRQIEQSPKYRALKLCPSTVRDVIEMELARHKKKTAAADAARKRLHRIAATYLGEPNYRESLQRLANTTHSPGTLLAACSEILEAHTSTSERLTYLSDFYSSVFSVSGLPRTILDLACGLNPFALPWMNNPALRSYDAYDCNGARVQFLNQAFAALQWPAAAFCEDILISPPAEPADVALLLKECHRMEERCRGITRRAIEGLKVDWLILSVPRMNRKGDRASNGRFRQVLSDIVTSLGKEWRELMFPHETVACIHLNKKGPSPGSMLNGIDRQRLPERASKQAPPPTRPV
jgi:16S rRNA (guanine(1405)-N(7))-methyltransferase